MKAAWLGLASLHGPLAGFVASNSYGVASPCAVSGCVGTIKVQSISTAAAACDPIRGKRKTTPPARAIASDTITPTSSNGEKRLLRADGESKGPRRSFSIKTYLFLQVCAV